MVILKPARAQTLKLVMVLTKISTTPVKATPSLECNLLIVRDIRYAYIRSAKYVSHVKVYRADERVSLDPLYCLKPQQNGIRISERMGTSSARRVGSLVTTAKSPVLPAACLTASTQAEWPSEPRQEVS
jgi:hypothetical protein